MKGHWVLGALLVILPALAFSQDNPNVVILKTKKVTLHQTGTLTDITAELERQIGRNIQIEPPFNSSAVNLGISVKAYPIGYVLDGIVAALPGSEWLLEQGSYTIRPKRMNKEDLGKVQHTLQEIAKQIPENTDVPSLREFRKSLTAPMPNLENSQIRINPEKGINVISNDGSQVYFLDAPRRIQ